ncbi:MAG: DNA polymerase III subunit delta' [Rhodoferax sp.]
MQTELAPWIRTQLRQLLLQRGHAWLLQGPSGLGQYTLALELARTWLCEQPHADGACGVCASCHAVDVRTHADLMVLMPEVTLIQTQWPLDEKAQAEIDDKKRKPSKEIRVEAMRQTVEFAQRTSSRGRGKVVLVYPAEQMNGVTANALLKTLEEPPGDVRFVLASESAHQLLPTIRSRCIAHTMHWPARELAVPWLLEQGVAPSDAASMLRAMGDRPEDVLAFGPSARSSTVWSQIPRAVARGEVEMFKDWNPPDVVDTLQKLCHDALALAVGADPRFFAAADLVTAGNVRALSNWAQALTRCRRTADHPFNAGLMLEALVAQAHSALNCKPESTP